MFIQGSAVGAVMTEYKMGQKQALIVEGLVTPVSCRVQWRLGLPGSIGAAIQINQDIRCNSKTLHARDRAPAPPIVVHQLPILFLFVILAGLGRRPLVR